MRYSRRGPIVAQIMILFHFDREQNRQHYHALSQQSTSTRDKRIVTCKNVSARTQASQNRDSCRDVRIRSGSNREIYLDNLVRTYVIESERAMRSSQIASPEIRRYYINVSQTHKDVWATITSYPSLQLKRSSSINYDVISPSWC